MDFDALIQRDSSKVISGFSETQPVTYLPKFDTPTPGAPRNIRAIIWRKDPQEIVKGQRGVTNPLTIKVANDSVLGITSQEFDPGVDKIMIAIEFGSDQERRGFSQEKYEADAGMLSIKVV